jgi:hypothetical protein
MLGERIFLLGDGEPSDAAFNADAANASERERGPAGDGEPATI